MPPACSGTKTHHWEGLALIGFGSGIHDSGIWATWAYVLITEWLYYYKRVTFFICSHARSLPATRIISGTHASDQEGLAWLGFGSGIHDSGIWAIWAHVLATKWLNYYKRVTFFWPRSRLLFPRLADQFRNPCPWPRRTCLTWHPSTRMTWTFGLFGHMCSSLNGFNYYKRVTFLFL